VPSNSASGLLRVVLCEDVHADRVLIQEALTLRFPDFDMSVYKDGEQMMRWLDLIESEYARCPDVILLDLNLPRFTGQQVLERLRGISRCELIPVVIVTSSDAPHARMVAARFGVTRYFAKPSEYDAFMRLGDLVYEVVSSANAAEMI
jgi:two-component system, chemotaxis family, response regulator Rcp1